MLALPGDRDPLGLAVAIGPGAEGARSARWASVEDLGARPTATTGQRARSSRSGRPEGRRSRASPRQLRAETPEGARIAGRCSGTRWKLEIRSSWRRG